MPILGGTRYTPVEIAEVALTVFDPDWNAINAVAVALAESGGWSRAIHLVDEDEESRAFLSLDLGLWQVNTFWHPTLAIDESLRPEVQVVYVAQIAKRREAWGYSWELWTTWRTGAYHDHLPAARAAVNQAAGVDI